MEIQFEKFNSQAELAKQRKLFVECFPETIGTPLETEQHYNWKFKSYPSETQKTAYEYVSKLNNEMIAYYAAIPYEYVVHGKNVTAAMVCDVMTGVKARGKGVFTKLGIYSTEQFKTEGLAFSTGYPIRPEVIPGHKKAGWDIPFQIPMYGKFIKMNSFLKTRNKSFLIPFANLFLKLYHSFLSISFFTPKNLVIENYSSSQIAEIKGIDEFLEKWKKENPIALNKEIKFLQWRLGAPEKNYHVIVLRNTENRNIIGYTVFRHVEKEGVPCIGVLDFCFLKKRIKHAPLLLKQISTIAKNEKAELILMMMMAQKAKDYRIKSNGYLKTPFPFSFIIKQFDNSLDSNFLKDENNWSLMWIDLDDL